MKRIYTVYFWSQHKSINDCAGNLSTWTGPAKSLSNALEKASKCHLHFRIKKVKITELEKVSGGQYVHSSQYEILVENMYLTFWHQYSEHGHRNFVRVFPKSA